MSDPQAPAAAPRLPGAPRWTLTVLRPVVLAPPVLAVAGALLLGALVMAVAGVSPGKAYPALINGAIGDGNLLYTIAAYVPTLGMAIVTPITPTGSPASPDCRHCPRQCGSTNPASKPTTRRNSRR